VTNNNISDFGAYGLGINGNGAAKLTSLILQGNTFTNTTTPGSQTVGLSLDDGLHALTSATCGGNIAGSGVTRSIINVPTGVTCNF